MQYQDCGIPEYWIIDPQTETILILELVGNSYVNFAEFKGDDLLRSPTFGQLKLRIVDILNTD